jgi:hypothetical protein
MDYLQRLRRLDTEENTDLADVRTRVQVLDLEMETAMYEVHRFQNIIILLTQKKQSAGRRRRDPQSVQATT